MKFVYLSYMILAVGLVAYLVVEREWIITLSAIPGSLVFVYHIVRYMNEQYSTVRNR